MRRCGKNESTVITTSSGHGLTAGMRVVLTDIRAPWYVRIWRFVTRYKPPSYTVRDVTATTFTIESKR